MEFQATYIWNGFHKPKNRGCFTKFVNGLNVCFTTASSHFFAYYMNIFHKTEVQTVILRCWMCLYLNWFKRYDTKCKYFHYGHLSVTNFGKLPLVMEYFGACVFQTAAIFVIATKSQIELLNWVCRQRLYICSTIHSFIHSFKTKGMLRYHMVQMGHDGFHANIFNFNIVIKSRQLALIKSSFFKWLAQKDFNTILEFWVHIITFEQWYLKR